MLRALVESSRYVYNLDHWSTARIARYLMCRVVKGVGIYASGRLLLSMPVTDHVSLTGISEDALIKAQHSSRGCGNS